MTRRRIIAELDRLDARLLAILVVLRGIRIALRLLARVRVREQAPAAPPAGQA